MNASIETLHGQAGPKGSFAQGRALARRFKSRVMNSGALINTNGLQFADPGGIGPEGLEDLHTAVFGKGIDHRRPLGRRVQHCQH